MHNPINEGLTSDRYTLIHVELEIEGKLSSRVQESSNIVFPEDAHVLGTETESNYSYFYLLYKDAVRDLCGNVQNNICS